jgi:transposase
MFDRVDPSAPGPAESAVYLAAEGRKNKGISGADKGNGRGRPRRRSAGLFQKLSAAEREELERWARQRTSPHRLVVRSRIVLLASEGLPTGTIANRLNVTPATVRLWTRRFAVGRLAALTREAPGRGRPRGWSQALTSAVLEATRAHAGHGLTIRDIAAVAHTSPSTVCRVWRRYNLGRDSSADSVDAARAQHAARAQLISETTKRS